ncbi:hypothetical protein VCHA34P129_40166 [Vibrio chagasii]|nr:hypothetical protein VCHA34P129_40166 [Vibrio chagasii]CAH7302194.1 hypothetical protein VCHA52P455_40166 [Vibrio chagasii]
MDIALGIIGALAYFLYAWSRDKKRARLSETSQMQRKAQEDLESVTLDYEDKLNDAEHEIIKLRSELEQCSDILKHYVNSVGVIGFESTEETDKESVMTLGYSDKLNQESFEEEISKFTNPQNSEYFKKRKSECSNNANFRNW